MSGQWGSELLDGPDDATDWTSLYTPAAPAYDDTFNSSATAVADFPSDYIANYGAEPAFEWTPPAEDAYSDAAAAPGYGGTYEDGSGPVAAVPQGPTPMLPDAGAMAVPAPEFDPFAQMMYQPSADLYGGQVQQDLPSWANPAALDSWESPANYPSTGEAFSTITGEDIGGGAPQNAGWDKAYNDGLLLYRGDQESAQRYADGLLAAGGIHIGGAGEDDWQYNSEGEINPAWSNALDIARKRYPYDEQQAHDEAMRIASRYGVVPAGVSIPSGPLPATDPNTGLPLDQSMYQQFGFGAEGSPLPSASRSILSNPNFAASNAQFDATTNPENRGGPGILGGIWNAVEGIAGPIGPAFEDIGGTTKEGIKNAFDRAYPYNFHGTSASGYSPPPKETAVGEALGTVGGAIAPFIIPRSPLDAALVTAPVLSKFGEGGRVAEQGFGGILAGSNLDALLGGGTKLDDFTARVPNILENPASLGGDLVQIPRFLNATEAAKVPYNLERGGGAADDAARFLDEVAKDPQWGQVINGMRAQKIADAEIVQSLAENGFTSRTEVGQAAKQFLEGTPAPEAPITDLKSALQKDLGITPKSEAASEIAPEVRRDLGIASKVDDPVEQATRDVLAADKSKQAASGWPDLEDAVQAERDAAVNEAGTVRQNERWMQEAAQSRAYALPPQDLPESNLASLVRAAQENPSTSTLAPLVDEVAKSKLGQQALNLGLDATDSRSLSQKIVDELISLTGLPRELKASFDQSIPGRQGLALAFRHSKEWIASWGTWARSWGSEDGFRVVDQDAQNFIAKWKQLAGDDGVVHLNTIDRGAPGTERIAGFEAGGEGFIRNVSKRLGTEKFERSAVAFLNSQRTRTMDTMFTAIRNTAEANRQKLIKAGLDTPEAMLKIAQDEKDSYRNIAAIIDHATGYGGAPLKGDIASRLLFSQRFMTSRFQFLVDPIVEGVIKGDMVAARAATENLVAFAGGSAALLAILDMGAEKVGVDALNVEWDPRSSDFGKIRIGPTRIDFGAGFLPLIRSAAQIGTGQKKVTTGEVVPLEKINMDTLKRESPYKARGNVAINFFRNKLDPVSSEVVTRLGYGTDTTGQAPTQIMSFSTLENLFAPLLAQSVHDNLRNGGDPATTAGIAGAEFFGGSGATYGAGQAAQQDTAQKLYNENYDSIPSGYQAQINAQVAASGTDLPISNRLSPWWSSRDDALTWYKSQIGPTQDDPRILAAKEATNYGDLQFRLQKLFEDKNGPYKMDRFAAEKEVTKTMDQMLGDNIDLYRKDIAAQDPGFAKAWYDAYAARETKYKPPVWVQDLAKGK